MIVTANFGIVTGDFGLHLKIGHDQLKSAVMIVRKNRSRSIEMSGHDGPKYAPVKHFQVVSKGQWHASSILIAGRR